MKNVKNTLRIGGLVLALVLLLAACGGGSGGGGGLTGTFVYEDGTPGTWTFTGDAFEARIPHSEMELDDIPGEFSLRGEITVDESEGTIAFEVDGDALETETRQLVDMVFAEDPELSAMMEDPAFAEMMENILEDAFNTMITMILTEFDDITWQAEDDFDRLIDQEGSVLVRQ